MQASFDIILRNGFSMVQVHDDRVCMYVVRVTALNIQVSLRNPTAMLEDNLYI